MEPGFATRSQPPLSAEAYKASHHHTTTPPHHRTTNSTASTSNPNPKAASIHFAAFK